MFQNAPVWEITGAEFSKSNVHTANGISIRFPRVTRIRDDKDWETATDVDHLQVQYIYTSSFGCTDTVGVDPGRGAGVTCSPPPKKKM